MIDISVRGLRKSFELNNWILDGLSFDVNAGERVCLLGKNGAGKTTLFRLLVGEISEDEGSIAIPAGRRLGLISQIPRYPEEYTAGDVLKTAYERLYGIQARMEELTRLMASDADRATLAEYDRLSADFERLGGYDMDFELERVANGLDIPEAMREQLFKNLSGGEKTRVNLARLILEDTDILLLDEPTNHLDLRATEWLEDYLLKFRGTVLAISHDRYFLDRVAQRTIELVHGRAEFYSGNYSFYVAEKQRRFEEKMRQYEKNQAKVEQLQRAADQMHLWAFMGADKLHKRAFSMEKRIARLQTAEKPATDKKMRAKFGVREFRGDEVLVMDGLEKGFGGRTLFSGLDLLMEPQERIALIGDNGAGKSTLIKLIMGEIQPDSGYVYKGPSVKAAYLPQLVSFEEPRLSVLETAMYEGKLSHQSARNRLAAYLFAGEDVFKPVSALSGGEQSRLRLCILMREDINLLILDEPTNHLDIAGREWMEAALLDYGEALLFVSHDRFFIERFATRIWELKDGALTDFPGGFAEYREYLQRQNAVTRAVRREERKKEKKKAVPSAEKRLAKVERDIAKAEAELARLDAETQEFASDYEKLLELGEKRAALETELEALYESWGELSLE